MSRDTKLYTVLSAKAATGAGNNILVEDFKTAVLSFDSASSANMTVKFAGSVSDDAPDFTAAKSSTNQYDYIQVIDLESGSAIDGDTGIALSGSDDNRQLEANVNGLKWLTAVVTARSAGSVTVTSKLFDNN